VVDPAVASANAFKTQGHILTVGIGPDFNATGTPLALSTAGQNKLAALEAISETTSPEVATPGITVTTPPTVPTFNAATTDTLLQPDPTVLSTSMKNLVTQQCAGSLTVRTQTTSPTSPVAFTSAVGRASKVTVPVAAQWLQPVAGTFAAESSKSGADGTSVYQWNQSSLPVSPTVSATIPAGYKLAKVACTRTIAGVTTVVPVAQAATFTIPSGIAKSAVVACTVSTYWTKASGIILTPRARTLTYGKTKITIGGQLLDSTLTGLRGRVVKFYGHKAGASKWVLLKTLTTGLRGKFAVAVAPTQSWQYFASFAGSTKPALTKSASVPTTITVAYSVTIVAKRVGTTSKYVLAGAIAPNAKGSVVTLQRYVSGRTWTTVTTTKANAKSAYAFVVYKLATAKIYRVVSLRKLPAYVAGISKNVKL